jgi:acetoacetyl-CoA synthetase
LWDLANRAKIETFGTSAAFIMACIKAGIVPKKEHNLKFLKSIGSTGSPLAIAGFKWCYQNVKSDLWLNSVSGGTDICSVFTGGLPTLPVYPGEIQCRSLGAKVESFDDNGIHEFNRVGEMVITEPMPSMPIYFWNDENYNRYTESYFEMYPNIWRHGDWLEITKRGGAIISGRSDSTLNRGGIRIGTAEIYSAIEKLPEIKDSLIIGLEKEGGDYYLPLFVVLQDGENLNNELIKKISTTLRKQFSPRHVPDEVFQIEEVPYTLSGKKMETPVKKYFRGGDIEKILNKDAMRNPEAFDFFMSFKINHIDTMPG